MGMPSTRHAEFLRTEGVALLAFSVLFYALHRAGACFHLAGARSQPVDFGAPSRKLNGSRALEPCVYMYILPGAFGVLAGRSLPVSFGLIWIAYIGFDRMMATV